MIANPEIIEGSVMRSLLHPMSEYNVEKQAESLLSFFTCFRLPQIKFPTLIACETADVTLPPVSYRTLADRIPNAKLVTHPGAGHAFTTQFAEELAREIKAFLGQKRAYTEKPSLILPYEILIPSSRNVSW